jgi:hypothetical protein
MSDNKNIITQTIEIKPLFLIILVIVILIAYITFSTRKNHKFDDFRINIAGRERMLLQKLTKEILLFQLNNMNKKDIEDTVSIFNNNLYSLIYGGKIIVTDFNGQVQQVPPIKETNIILQFNNFVKNWEIFKSIVNNYLINKDNFSLDFIIENNLKLLILLENIVALIQNSSEMKDQIMIILIYTLITILFVSLSLYLYIQLTQLKNAKKQIHKLESMLPICSNCKKIRIIDQDPYNINSWQSIEEYMQLKDNTRFTHSVCPSCMVKLYPELYRK